MAREDAVRLTFAIGMSNEQPLDLEAAVRAVLAVLSPEQMAELRSVPEDAVPRYWFWLWEGRAALCSELSRGAGEGTSSVILKAVWNHLRGEPLTQRVRRIERAYTCPSCGREAIATGWEPAELDAGVLEPCPDCKAIARASDAIDYQNAEPLARFDRARALGLAFRDAHRAEAGGSDPEALVALASSRCDRDPEFRALWRAVYDAPPSAAHAAWLHLWTIGDV